MNAVVVVSSLSVRALSSTWPATIHISTHTSKNNTLRASHSSLHTTHTEQNILEQSTQAAEPSGQGTCPPKIIGERSEPYSGVNLLSHVVPMRMRRYYALYAFSLIRIHNDDVSYSLLERNMPCVGGQWSN